MREWRDDPGLVLLEGFHAVKHALRFGAQIEHIATADDGLLDDLAAQLAPDLRQQLSAAEAVSVEDLKTIAGTVPHTKVVAVARRPGPDEQRRAALSAPGHVVLLEDPRHLGNVGAVIRVAAAAGAGGVLTTGERDPWDVSALRGAAGLHYALPVAQLAFLREIERPIVVFDPGAPPLAGIEVPPDAVLAFGTERDGVSPELTGRAIASASLPMRPGVSSLNLATSVAAVLYLLGLEFAPGSLAQSVEQRTSEKERQ